MGGGLVFFMFSLQKISTTAAARPI